MSAQEQMALAYLRKEAAKGCGPYEAIVGAAKLMTKFHNVPKRAAFAVCRLMAGAAL